MNKCIIALFLILHLKSFGQNTDNYDRLIATVVSKVSDHRVVGVGEATHGTADFFNFKADVFKQLVIEKGFSVFIMEASFTQSKAINAYIYGLDSIPLDTILLNYDAWPWHTAEFKRLINWMRVYNDTSALNKVSFYGMDFQYSGQLNKIITNLKPFIDKENLDWLQSLKGTKLSSESIHKIESLYTSNSTNFIRDRGRKAFLESKHEYQIIKQKNYAFGFSGPLKVVKGIRARDHFMYINAM